MQSAAARWAGLCAAGLTLVATVPAQYWFWTQRDRIPSGPVVFDLDRGRAVSFNGGTLLEWNGTGWDERDGALAPSGIGGHALGYHAATGQTVLFGGYNGRWQAYSSATYFWDGARWSDHPGARPERRVESTFAYDDRRQRLVLFGGFYYSPRDDTWEWDGTSWHERTPATQPSARRRHAMTFDSTRGVTVLFGGRSTNTTLADTWEWNGSTWTQRATSGPPGENAPRMAFDAGRGVAVLRTLDETWEWDGVAWTRASTVPPNSGFGRELFYDPVRSAVVTLGDDAAQWTWDGIAWNAVETRRRPKGLGWPQARQLAYDSARRRAVTVDFNETSEWDGVRWRVQTVSPAPRLGRYALVYDPVRAETVLFGGTPDGQIQTDETWTWDGTTWTRKQPVNAPSPRSRAMMAWDPVHRRVLLFGGWNATQLLDTWAWDGTNWTPLTPATTPPASSPTAATDSARGRIVMPIANVGTWEWDGTDWANVGGLPRYGVSAVAYHPHRGVTIASNGIGGMAHWDGTTWTELVGSGSPAGGRSGFWGGMTFDETLDAVVQLGDGFPETWVFAERDGAEAIAGPAGCTSGTQVVLTAAGTPWIGHDAFAFDVVDGPSTQPGAVLLSGGSGSTPFGSCTVRVDLAQLLASAPIATSPLGFASVGVAVPLAPSLVGAQLFAQGAVLDFTQSEPVRWTNLVEARVGY